MSDSKELRPFSIGVVVVVALASAGLTWLCVSWFGTQGPVTAMVAVLLVELFLACFGVIAILLAARLSDSYLQREQNHPEQPQKPPRLWLWAPIWQPAAREFEMVETQMSPRVPVNHWLSTIHEEMSPLSKTSQLAKTIPFPATAVPTEKLDNRPIQSQERRRAA